MIFSVNVFTTFVLPALVITVLAAIIAFFLSFLGNKLKVDHDERIDEVRGNLSGANCGGCGFAGCDAFAEALVKGEASLSQCHSTPDEGRENIAKILGIAVEKSDPTVAVVHCIGGANCADKFTYVGAHDCALATGVSGGCKACSYGCLGLGTCVKACPYGAIKVGKDDVSQVDYEICRSCGACISACPKGIVDRIPASAKVYVGCSNHGKGKEVIAACKKGCIACGKCERSCPEGAIKLVDNLPVIDYKKCVGCYACADGCPRKCIIKIGAENVVG